MPARWEFSIHRKTQPIVLFKLYVNYDLVLGFHRLQTVVSVIDSTVSSSYPPNESYLPKYQRTPVQLAGPLPHGQGGSSHTMRHLSGCTTNESYISPSQVVSGCSTFDGRWGRVCSENSKCRNRNEDSSEVHCWLMCLLPARRSRGWMVLSTGDDFYMPPASDFSLC